MVTSTDPPTDDEQRLLDRVAAFDGVRLDAAVMAFTVVGLYGNLLDIQGHDAGISFEEEGFLTVPHIIFYSAFAAIAITVAVVIVARRHQLGSWRAAVPKGYRLALLGIGLFALGGPSDALWHFTFSAESGVEALTSPTHLMLATGALLFLSAPLRRAWGLSDLRGRLQAPMVLSAAFTLTGATIITLYAHPVYGDQWVTEGTNVSLGVASVMLQAAVLTAVVLLLVRRFDLAPGALTVVVAVNGFAMTWVGESFYLLPGIVAAGVVADALHYGLDPASGGRRFRLFAALVPATYYAAYFASIEATAGIAWVVHISAGSVVLAGYAGLLVSYVVAPSRAAWGADGAVAESAVDGRGDRPTDGSRRSDDGPRDDDPSVGESVVGE